GFSGHRLDYNDGSQGGRACATSGGRPLLLVVNRRRPSRRNCLSVGASSERPNWLRLLRGEALDAVPRESQVPAHELENWKRVFLETGARGLKTRSDPEERELTLARAKIGELMMRLELAEYLIEKRGLRTSGRGSGDERRSESWDRRPVSADDELRGLASVALDRLRVDGAGAC